jgi:hypothetical protein
VPGCGAQLECCQLLTSVCGDADAADMLDEYGALKRAAEAMSTHWDDKAIQLHGCRLVVRFGGAWKRVWIFNCGEGMLGAACYCWTW